MILSHALRAIRKNITFVGTSEATGSGNAFTVTYPAGTEDGDIAIICITTPSNMSSGYSATGWTSLNANSEQPGVKSNLLYRVVSGTGTQSFSKGSSAPSELSYIVAVFRNAAYSSFNVASGDDSPNPPSLTGSFNLVVAFGSSSASDSTVTPPTGYTTLGEINNTNITTMGGYLIGPSTNPNPSAFSGITVGTWTYTAYTIGLT